MNGAETIFSEAGAFFGVTSGTAHSLFETEGARDGSDDMRLRAPDMTIH
jgi:hypothetical protein